MNLDIWSKEKEKKGGSKKDESIKVKEKEKGKCILEIRKKN